MTATNGASRSTYNAESAPKDAINSSTLYTGFRCAITSSDATTAMPPNKKNNIDVVSGCSRISHSEIQHAGSGHEKVHDRQRQEHLPAESHQLVVPVPRQRPAHPDVEEEDRRHFDEEPDPSE